MAMVDLPHPVVLTPFAGAIPTGAMATAIGSASTFVLNGAGDKLAVVFTARTTVVPDLISFFVSAATAGTTGDIEATLETLTTGEPGGAVTNSATGTATVNSTGLKTISGMAGTATVTAGTVYAIVLTAGAGWDRSITIRIANGSAQGGQAHPYVSTKDSAGAWTKSAPNNMGYSFGIANSSGTYQQITGLVGAYDGTQQNFGSATNPDERGNRFVLDAPMRLCGCIALYSAGSAPGANDDCEFKLLTTHTATPTEVLTHALLGEDQAAAITHFITFGSTYTCAAGTVYALTMEAVGTDTKDMLRWEYGSNAHLAGVLGTDFYSTTRNDGGSCTDTDDMIYGLFPVFDQIDDATGGGGGATGSGIVGLHGISSGVIA